MGFLKPAAETQPQIEETHGLDAVGVEAVEVNKDSNRPPEPETAETPVSPAPVAVQTPEPAPETPPRVKDVVGKDDVVTNPDDLAGDTHDAATASIVHASLYGRLPVPSPM